MSDRSTPRESWIDDDLLHLDRMTHRDIRSHRPMAHQRSDSSSVRTQRAAAGASEAVTVALLADERGLAEMAAELIAAVGWAVDPIDVQDLAAATGQVWDLIVIATDGDSIQIAPACALASRDARQRVLIISHEHDPQIIADALNSGADDYVIAPFDMDECRARMRVLVKRSGIPSQPHSNMLWIEPLLRTVGIGSLHATLSSREWSLLKMLIDADQQPVTAEKIEEQLWGAAGRQSTLASVVSRLRQRLDSHRLTGIEIVTVRGTGYAVRYTGLDTSHLREATYPSAMRRTLEPSFHR